MRSRAGRALALLVCILLIVPAAAYGVRRFGFTVQTEVAVNNQVNSDWDDLWFSPEGELITTRVETDGGVYKVVTAQQLLRTATIDTKGWVEVLRKDLPEVEKNQNGRRPRSDADTPEEEWRRSPVAVRRDGTAVAKYYKGLLLSGTNGTFFNIFPINRDAASQPDKADDVVRLAFMENGLLALAYGDGRLELRRTPDAELIQESQTGITRPTDLRVFGKYLVVSSDLDSAYAVLWLDSSSKLTGTPRRNFPPKAGSAPYGIAVSANGRLAIASGTSLVQIGEAEREGLKFSVQAPSPVTVVAFTADDKVAVGGNFPGNSFGIYLLSQDGKTEQLVDTHRRVRLLAGDAEHLAYVTEGSSFGSDVATTALLSLPRKRVLNNSGKAIIVMAVLLALPSLYHVLPWQYWLDVIGHRLGIYGIKDVKIVLPLGQDSLTLPDPPAELVEACAARNCVLYAGAGLSAQAGLSTWQKFMHALLDWAVKNGFMEQDAANSFHHEIDEGATDVVADLIVSAVRTNGGLLRLHDYLRDTFLRSWSLPESYSLLGEINFSAALTTNFDNLLERSYGLDSARVFTPQNTEELLAALTRREFFILKLYGTLDRPDTVMVAPTQYEDAVSGNREFAQFMGTLFRSRTLLFVGASLEGIETYQKGITLPRDIATRHWALVAVTGDVWRAKADFLEQRYRIKVLPFTPSSDYQEIRDFLRRLADEVAARAKTGRVSDHTTARLKELSLKNIGPFESLDIKFDAHWNILLGDNGVGKSSILKSIGVALSGERAQPYAERLIKSGEDEGTIILKTDKGTVYETRLIRKGEEAEVVSNTARPLVAESWLTVGFPPLRTTSWERPKPDVETSGKSRSTPDDILPLVKGETDPRLDKLKQWIVSIDYQRSRKEEEQKGSGARYEKLVKDLFEVINRMSRPLRIEYRGVHPLTRKVQVETEHDGPIPIEAVSQGLISLISWVGVLMQRFYEVYEEADEPTKNYALVLMDEIDAHMHPAWQQMLVRHLKDAFINAQFIATTHSPLIVGGMPPEQLHRFLRDQNGKVRYETIDPDMTVGRADQILTGDLFSLDTTLDVETQESMEDYEQLLERQARAKREGRVLDEPDQQELLRLQSILSFRIPKSAETPPERQAQKLIESLLEHHIDDKYPEVKTRVLGEAEKLLKMIQSRQETTRDDKS